MASTATKKNPLPPRPNAIATLITTDDFLAGAQTLLYSIRKSLLSIPAADYPPEIVVLTTTTSLSITSISTLEHLCDRIITVPFIKSPVKSHVPSWDTKCAFTKLNLFKLQEYEKILYLDADCLVLKDVSHLFKEKFGEEKTELVAAPDIFPPDKFNGGVLLLKPSQSIFQSLLSKFENNFESYDGGDTGFLNAYFSDWYTSSTARLPFKYNAQRYVYDVTFKKQPGYWQSVGDIVVLHYSSTPKTWERISKPKKQGDEEDLDDLWWKWYEESSVFLEKYDVPVKSSQKPKPIKKVHTDVIKRYKELRKEGKDIKSAMVQARIDCGVFEEKKNVGDQVADLFGIRR